jgi:hypothetical protein
MDLHLSIGEGQSDASGAASGGVNKLVPPLPSAGESGQGAVPHGKTSSVSLLPSAPALGYPNPLLGLCLLIQPFRLCFLPFLIYRSNLYQKTVFASLSFVDAANTAPYYGDDDHLLDLLDATDDDDVAPAAYPDATSLSPLPVSSVSLPFSCHAYSSQVRTLGVWPLSPCASFFYPRSFSAITYIPSPLLANLLIGSPAPDAIYILCHVLTTFLPSTIPPIFWWPCLCVACCICHLQLASREGVVTLCSYLEAFVSRIVMQLLWHDMMQLSVPHCAA